MTTAKTTRKTTTAKKAPAKTKAKKAPAKAARKAPAAFDRSAIRKLGHEVVEASDDVLYTGTRISGEHGPRVIVEFTPAAGLAFLAEQASK